MNIRPKKALFILGGLDDNDLRWIINRSKKKVISPGEILIYEGEAINALYIILSGLLSVSISTESKTELALLPEGEVVGEISFVDSRPPLATVKAIKRSEVLVIPRYALSLQLHRNSGFSSRFYQGICLCLASRMRGTVRRLGYAVEDDDPNLDMQDINQSTVNFLTLAEAKFTWLIQNLENQ
ncbi:MAG: cyclic nucleotide-binding domain-containing protein [Microcoleaceae cyanobacterium]